MRFAISGTGIHIIVALFPLIPYIKIGISKYFQNLSAPLPYKAFQI